MENLGTIIAIYGAALSTILGVLELNKLGRKINIILQYDYFTEEIKLIIYNYQSKPIIISSIVFEAIEYQNENKFNELVPQNAMFSNEIARDNLPIVLNEGESKIYILNHVMNDYYSSNEKTLIINVFDINNKKFEISIVREFNVKFGDTYKKTNKFTEKGAKKFFQKQSLKY